MVKRDKVLVVLVAVGVWLGAVGATQAVLSLELSSPDDLANLTVGDTATIEVSLAGLDTTANEQLVSLEGSVLLPSGIFGSPTNITPGAIIPNPLDDPFDFGPADFPGEATAFFFTFSTDPNFQITTNGVFFTFDVTAGTAGSGEIAINPDPFSRGAELVGLNAPLGSVPVDVDAGPPLAFNVTDPPGPGPGSSGAVPEPLTATLGVLSLGVLKMATCRRAA